MTRYRAAAVVVGLLLLGAQACGDEDDVAASPDASPAAVQTSLADCRNLIPASVAESLGWSDVAPTLDSATCTMTAPEGQVTVARRPVAATTSSELPDAAQEAFTEQCAELDQGQPAEDVDWFGPDIPACATDPESSAGVNVLVDAVVRPGVIAQFSVFSAQAVDAGAVQTALGELQVAATDGL